MGRGATLLLNLVLNFINTVTYYNLQTTLFFGIVIVKEGRRHAEEESLSYRVVSGRKERA